MKIKIYININNKYKIFEFRVLNFQIFKFSILFRIFGYTSVTKF